MSSGLADRLVTAGRCCAHGVCCAFGDVRGHRIGIVQDLRHALAADFTNLKVIFLGLRDKCGIVHGGVKGFP